ncbi:dihydrolipoyllysine-residue acetyltransferase [Melioribacteraceae bacterium 4301-Me]|uniref:dihydrolipoyllysine-residue acetyltransferase n=1 Tax=Pyranulibacter aquaticus TaxID=3163344 RepID=UPI003596408D
MTIEFKLPELGENIESADILKILVSEGDKVKVDQPVLEIETDKATIEVPSDVNGVIKKIHVKEGTKAKVGQIIFTLEEDSSRTDIKGSANGNKTEKVTAGEPIKKINETTPKAVEQEINKRRVKAGIYEFKIPNLGENVQSADITKVLVSKGDKISVDQTVLEIETDKATVEVPSEIEGIIKEVKVKEGDKVKVGDVVFIIETTSIAEKETQQEPETKISQPSTVVTESKEQQVDITEISTVPDVVDKIKHDFEAKAKLPSVPSLIAPAAPSVRRFAREIGVDIHKVKGTGPSGRITVEDVKAYAKGINEQITKGGIGIGVVSEALPDFSKWGEVERQSMSNVRRKTAEHLSYAWATIPHVTQFDKADITELENLRKQFGKKAEEAGGKLTVTAILLKVVASALKVFPQFNSSVDMIKGEIIYKKYFNIGVAVDTEKGLLVPVIKNVDKKNIIQLSVELAEISKKARDKKLSLEDMQGGCFTISNLGGIGGTYFTPVVNSPEVAILGVSKATYEQRYINNKFEPRLMMPLSLSYDHRVIDGADGIRFLRWVVNALENPFLLSLEG